MTMEGVSDVASALLATEAANVRSALKQALRALARSVVVITARHDGRRFAMAATAVSEVSLDPPSMLICVNRSASLFEAIDAGANFAINVLGDTHEAVSRACGGEAPLHERFNVGSWNETHPEAPPLLADASAAVVLSPASHMDYGTHRIVVGQVRSVVLGTMAPLVFHNGGYPKILA